MAWRDIALGVFLGSLAASLFKWGWCWLSYWINRGSFYYRGTYAPAWLRW